MWFAGVLLYVALTLIRPQELVPEWGQYQLMDIAAALASLLLLIGALAGERLSFRAPQLYLCAAFIFWAAFSLVLSLRWFGGAWFALQSLSINAFVFFLTALGATDMKRLEALRRMLLLALLITAAMAMAGYFLHWHEEQFVLKQRIDPTSPMAWMGGGAAEEEDDFSEAVEIASDDDTPARPRIRRLRALGFLNDPNDFAQMLVAALPLFLPGYRPGRFFRNLVFLVIPGAFFLVAIFLTRSRGGILTLLALVGFVIDARLSRGTRRAIRVLAAPVLLVLAGTLIIRARADPSAFGRLEAWSEGIQMLKGSPVWGVGFGNFLDYHHHVAHNSFVQCFAELGLVGYTLWLTLLLLTLSDLSALERVPDSPWGRWPRALRLSLTAFLTGALLLSRTYSPILFLLLGTAAALLAFASHEMDLSEEVPATRLAVRVVFIEVASILALWIAMRLIY